MLQHALSLMIAVTSVTGWSVPGHRAVAEIAFNLMHPTITANFVRTKLRLNAGQDLKAEMMSGSVWPDSILQSRPETAAQHHISLPDKQCGPVDLRRDCSGQCVVKGIASNVIGALNTGETPEDQMEAMKFVLHLLGDIAIPVHTGFVGDRGGNMIHLSGADHNGNPVVNLHGQPFNLHGVWDFHLPRLAQLPSVVQGVRTMPADALFDGLDHTAITYETIIRVSMAMVDESHQLACSHAYKHAVPRNAWIRNNDYLEHQYWERCIPIAHSQIVKAGVRLAKLLDLMALASLNLGDRAGLAVNPSGPAVTPLVAPAPVHNAPTKGRRIVTPPVVPVPKSSNHVVTPPVVPGHKPSGPFGKPPAAPARKPSGSVATPGLVPGPTLHAVSVATSSSNILTVMMIYVFLIMNQ